MYGMENKYMQHKCDYDVHIYNGVIFLLHIFFNSYVGCEEKWRRIEGKRRRRGCGGNAGRGKYVLS